MFNQAYLRSKTSAVDDDGWSFWQHHQQHPLKTVTSPETLFSPSLAVWRLAGTPPRCVLNSLYIDPSGQRSELFWTMPGCSQQSAELWTPSLYLYIGTTSLLD